MKATMRRPDQNPYSTRRKSWSLDTAVVSANVAIPTVQPSATSAWPCRAMTACAVARATM